MKLNRSAPVLLLGFGMLVGLIAISGGVSRRRASETYREFSALNERYRRTERNLNGVASGIYTVGLLARDYLLDPSNQHGEEYRSQLVAERASMEAEFQELEKVIRALRTGEGGREKPPSPRLRTGKNAAAPPTAPTASTTRNTSSAFSAKSSP